MQNGPHLGFTVPIIFDFTRSGIAKLSRQQLLDALDQLDSIENAETN